MKYLYGIVRGEQVPVETIGMDGAAVTYVAHDGLAVLVSDTDVEQYEQTRRYMMVHTKVLEEGMRHQNVLPIRFNTIAPREEIIVEQLLTQRRDEILGLFEMVDGRIELGVKAYWYQERLFDDVVASNPPIQQLRDSLVGKGENESYYERIELGQMIEKAIEQKREDEKEQILQELQPLAKKMKTSHIGSERMVVNASFLIDRQREEAFDAAVNKLDGVLGEKMKFKYVGPVPPYNFVNLVVRWR